MQLASSSRTQSTDGPVSVALQRLLCWHGDPQQPRSAVAAGLCASSIASLQSSPGDGEVCRVRVCGHDVCGSCRPCSIESILREMQAMQAACALAVLSVVEHHRERGPHKFPPGRTGLPFSSRTWTLG